MIRQKDVIVMDLDGTLCPIKQKDQRYEDLRPIPEVYEKLLEFRAKGWYIIISTARNMRTHEGNMGLINAHTTKSVLKWLEDYEVPYDEIYFGKPWAGHNGFYVDDKAIRPSEFISMNLDEIRRLIGNE